MIYVLLFVIHAWVLWGHRVKMGTDPKDRPQDPIFSRHLQILAFTALLLTQAAVMVHRILNPVNTKLHLTLGVIVFFSGLALRLWSVRILGRLFTFEIGIRPEHRIIEEGPYRFIRHPSYTGYLLILAGISVAYSSWFLFLTTFLSAVGFLLVRIRQEEKMLLSHFGPAYAEYIKRTKRLIPFLY